MRNLTKSSLNVLLLGAVCALPAPASRAADAGHESGSTSREPAKLPLSEIVLYTSGVGYFARDGQVNGRSSVELQFKTDDINDLLKSMVVQDQTGGQVPTVTYGSRDPITKTLKSFGIDLTSNPTLGQLLDQVRGEKVELMRPNPLVGTVLGVEKKTEQLGDNKTVEREYLNLLTEGGLESVPLNQVQRIKLLNERMDRELQQALAVLATSHDTQKKTVTINFDGAGKRQVGVAYIEQTPVWKTSYRLVLDQKEGPLLQGWAIVENTSDEDWENVHLSLVSGRPISFAMDLYQPLYIKRPVVAPELYASVKPQVYNEALQEDENVLRERMAAVPAAAPMATRTLSLAKSMASAESLGRRGYGGMGGGGTAGLDAAQAHLGFDAAAQVAAQGAEAGELFQYVIEKPVSLARQKSSMLPILNQTVAGEKVSIYNEQVEPKYPLNGFRLKNNTSLHLMQGPVTVFDGGRYAGDARLADLAPGQDRLLSYALDIETEVKPASKGGTERLTSASLRKGVLSVTRKLTEEKTYTIRNRGQKEKTILVEHPSRADWKLIEPKEPAERTRDVYRFAVKVRPNETKNLVVKEEKPLSDTIELLSSAPDVIGYYLQAKAVSPEVKQALEKVVSLRNRLDQTQAERARHEQRVAEISQEQARIRENMARLNQTSELYNRYVTKLDQQETELENLRKQIESLKSTEAKQRQDLNDYLLNLNVS